MGTDFVQFARAGAVLSGIDLTEISVSLVNRRLSNEGLHANVQVADAESLPFPDSTFELVYSWGVLHHTPQTEQAIAEVWRVLEPSGEARIMLYSRRSWLALGYWARYALLRGRPWDTVSSVLAHHVESPGTKAYTWHELSAMFYRFSDVRITPFVTAADRRVAGPLASLARNRYGWFLGVSAKK